MNKRLFILLIAFKILCASYAQEQYFITQYMFNTLLINPAYASSSTDIIVNSNIREQWIGIKGAPRTQSISAQFPIPKKKIALGVVISNDKIGVTSQQDINLIYAYKIYSDIGILSLGFRTGVYTYWNNFNELNLSDTYDNNFDPNTKNLVNPKLGLGVYFHNDDFNVGISVPNMLKEKFIKKDNVIQDERLLYTLHGAYYYKVNEKFSIKPHALLKGIQGSNMSIDLNTTFYINNFLGFGISYRALSSVSFLTEFEINKIVAIGYTYDMATTDIKSVKHLGSHELNIKLRFNKFANDQVYNPRYF